MLAPRQEPPASRRQQTRRLPALIEFAHRNGRTWTRSSGDPADTDAMIRGVADGSVTQAKLESWIAERTSPTPVK